jgi:hypothetical protein
MMGGEADYALDLICHSFGHVAAWDGYVLHDGRIHPYSTRTSADFRFDSDN